MHPLNKTARVAGLLYLLVVLTGPFVLIYVPGRLFVAGDPTATAANILSHQTLFRADIVVGLIAELLFIAVVLMLFRLLKGVNLELAVVMVLLILLDVPNAFLGMAHQAATLSFLRDGQFLSAFGKPQRDALATLMLRVDGQGVAVSEVFWGLWLLPLGALVYRSTFLPRLIGVWLVLNGLAYLAISVTAIMWPEHSHAVSTAATPLLFGEVALTLWLLVVGVRARAPATG